MGCSLNDCLSFSNGKKYPNSKGNIPIYGGNGVLGYCEESNASNCIIIGRVGAYCGSVYYEKGKSWVSDNAIMGSAKEGFDIRFLYYLLLTLNLQKRQQGTSQPLLTQGLLKSINIPRLPEISTQRRVSSFLSLFDQKIELNNLVNDYLAEIAIALFNKQCPQTKQLNAVLSNIAEITMGQSPVGSSYNEEGNGVVFYQGRAEFGSFFPRRRLFTTEPKRMAREGDTLMSVRAPVGDLNVANEDCCIGRGLAAIHSEGSQSFVHYLMRAQAKQLNSFNNNGTVFGSINGKALKELPVFLPSNDAIASLDSLLEPIDMLIRRNDDEIQALEQLRDALLPKLMSGEINVSEVEVPTQLNNHLCDCLYVS